jgi:hypothetical protein
MAKRKPSGSGQPDSLQTMVGEAVCWLEESCGPELTLKEIKLIVLKYYPDMANKYKGGSRMVDSATNGWIDRDERNGWLEVTKSKGRVVKVRILKNTPIRYVPDTENALADINREEEQLRLPLEEREELPDEYPKYSARRGAVCPFMGGEPCRKDCVMFDPEKFCSVKSNLDDLVWIFRNHVGLS